jgi:hypothetical protein
MGVAGRVFNLEGSCSSRRRLADCSGVHPGDGCLYRDMPAYGLACVFKQGSL